MNEDTPDPNPPSTSRAGSKPPGMWLPPSLEEMQAMLPQYEFEVLLGHGGMGAVYKAVQISLDRAVAIKVLPGELLEDADVNFTERFINEARLMAKMNHPAIVNVHDFGETQTGLLYIVMEFIDGTDVSKMIATQGRLPEEHALAITAHVCDALEYAHTHGVIHRDIKPANVLINMEGAVKVADFGLAKASDPNQAGLTQTNMAMGTPDFVAPEALLPGIPLDGRADIYAVGVMLYQMLTGNIPRGAWTMPSVMVQTDPRFDAIIARAMQMDREGRHQTALELRRDLDVILTVPYVHPDDKHSSAAIPKNQLVVARQQQQVVVHRGAKKPAIVHAGQPSRRPQRQVVTYVPQRSSSLLTLVAAVLIGGAALFVFQKLHKPAAAPGESAPIKVVDTPAPATALLPEGVLTFGGHRYKFLPGPFVRNEDAEVAKAAGGLLLAINSAEEQRWIEQTYTNLIAINSGGKCRIGGRSAADGNWSLKSWGYENWAAGFPTSNSAKGVLILKHDQGTLPWQDTFWSDKGSTIIEWNDTTTPIALEPLRAPPASALPAPPDAYLFGGHRYKLIPGFVTWIEARDQAAAMGGHLATLTTREEDDWARKTFVDQLQPERIMHIGAYKPPGTSECLWITGEPWAFENWRTKKDGADAFGINYQNIAGGKSGWTAIWSAAYRISITTGPYQGQQRAVGFLVEWDSDRTSSPVIAASGSAGVSGPASADSPAFGGHRYRLIQEKVTWTVAKQKAEAMGGHLAAINSAAEDAWTKQQFGPLLLSGNEGTSIWLGGVQEESGGPWKWVTGEAFTFTGWHAGEPNNKPATYPDCVALARYSDGELGWNDAPHEYGGGIWGMEGSIGFLVEWDGDNAPIASAARADSLAFGGHRYKMVADKAATWTQAKAAAEAMGGHLATITSKEENDWIASSMITKLELGLSAWIGGTSEGAVGRWRWITGEPFSFTAWNSGEPSNNSQEIAMVFTKNDGGKLGWGDLVNGGMGKVDRRGGYIVEWDHDHLAAPPLADRGSQPMSAATAQLAQESISKPDDTVLVMKVAAWQAWFRNDDDLAATRERMLRSAAGTTSAQTAERVAKLVSLGPGASASQRAAALALAEKAVELGQGTSVAPWYQLALGMAQYRSGRHAEAGENLAAAARTSSSVVNTGQPTLLADAADFYRVMVLVQQDKRAEARALLTATEARMKPLPAGIQDAAAVQQAVSHDQVISWLACKEAKALLDEPPRLLQLKAQFKEAFDRDVTNGVAAKAITDLDTKYLAAIDRALADATKAGKLDDVTALRAEKQRIADHAPMPATDPVNIVTSLANLRATYRKTLTPLITKRDADTDAVYARYDQALAALQIELTQKGEIADAQRVRAKRSEIDLLRQPAAPPPSVTSVGGPSPNLASFVSAGNFPDKEKSKKNAAAATELPPEMLKEPPPKPFTPEEAIHWALSLNGSAKVMKGKTETEIINIGSIPKGKYVLVGLKIGDIQPLHIVSLAGLSQLTELRELTLDRNLITDAGLAFLPPLPKLVTLGLQDCGLTDAGLAHLAKQPALAQLNVGNNKISGAGLAQLPSAARLTSLGIGSPNLTDEGMGSISKCRALTALDLSNSGTSKCTSLAPLAAIPGLRSVRLQYNTTDALVQSLATVTRLEALDLSDSPITDFALDRISAMTSLHDLNFYGCKNLTDSGYLKLLPLGKSVTRLIPARTRLSDTGFNALTAKLTEITEIDLCYTGVSPAGLAGLENLRKLSALSVHARHCTDEGLRHLSRATGNLNLKTFGIREIETLDKKRLDAVRRSLPRYSF